MSDTIDRLPAVARAFLENASRMLRADARIRGVALAGSYASGNVDAYSDLDLVVATEAGALCTLDERVALAQSLGPLVAAFIGDHVNEPRLLVTLYGPPALHVDFKFIAPADIADRIDEPVVSWECEGELTAALAASRPRSLAPDPQWIEDRFWVWVHYAATKIGRGEYFEAIDFLGHVRRHVLAPLARLRDGSTACALRRIEQHAPVFARSLEATLARADRADLIRAVRATVAIYRSLQVDTLARGVAAEALAMAYLDGLEHG